MAGEPTPLLLSVVVPAYDEEKRLPQSIEQIERYLEARQVSYELILVDDGSSDGTRQVMAAAAERNQNVRVEALPANRGKGRALATGVAVTLLNALGLGASRSQVVARIAENPDFRRIRRSGDGEVPHTVAAM